jgi:putative transposase
MWIVEQRTRHKVLQCKMRRGYPTDISDKAWKLVESLLPGAARTGRPCKTRLRHVINVRRYLVRFGCE